MKKSLQVNQPLQILVSMNSNKNRIQAKKLLHSKWTAAKPFNKEKHFMITEVEFDEEGQVIHCLIEAIRSQRSEAIEWSILKNRDQWIQGWK